MSEDHRVAAVILAAGASRRYGSPKQLVVVDGRTLLEHAIDTAMEVGLAPVVAVVPVWLSRPARLDDDRLLWIRNPFPERGLSLSLRLAFGSLGDEATAALILLGDQPRVPATTIAALLAARGQRPIVASQADGVLAPPLVIERSHFSLVDGLTGDVGLRQLLHANPELVRPVEVAMHPPDVDTPDDLGRIGRP
ncbi:MAG TPA: nucleotidyltransferase family protein [Candidatus Limnocylindria bacterium]|nr:nucleotidyltransferase family protein [Candidatus Limnocylindria bacterium]